MKTKSMILGLMTASLLAFGACSSDEGESGDTPIDCGEHGSEHDGHCHCETGFLFNGTTCVSADQITEECHEHDADAGAEHHHEACVCPATGDCHCEEGTIETIGANSYCVPNLHD